ncbi:MAG: tRNA (N(6)-L-threonylcarbamoyladenosine(37)-C(2))-methylthiotransferase MtaB [Firmicutes bacterium HGW-Firmicutes-15]|nr:MAG: tRNA (N(6)-L-threonylcarbamoyladenosine(37)-C(2))-methylthiotransferase MtaB [Firmicutes bacterium HGW-Firmicutes-15]
MRKIAFHTLGCKVNQVETEQMIEEFTKRGYRIVEFGDPADVCIINTCTVTHISDRKSRAMLRRAVRANPDALVVATGCVAQVDADQLTKIEGIGLIVGNHDKDHIADIVDDFIMEKEAGQQVWVEPICLTDSLRPVLYSQSHLRTRAFVKIQDGCQSFCSYCIVPFARGPVRSKAPDDVIAEISQLICLGYREIVLTGIHTGLYGVDLPGWNITRLLEKILWNISGDYRIRLSSIEPLELNDQLIALMAGDKRLCRHFHIPLQSGSDRILTSMRRRYNREYYRDLVLKTAALIPGAAFTADVMVGYPTETELDFQDTYDLIKDLPLYELHVFKYSPRAGTSAAILVPQIAPAEKQSRSEALLDLGRKKKKHFLQEFVGQDLSVLVERKLSRGIYAGISDNYIEVHFSSSEELIGEFVQVTLSEVGENHGNGVMHSRD